MTVEDKALEDEMTPEMTQALDTALDKMLDKVPEKPPERQSNSRDWLHTPPIPEDRVHPLRPAPTLLAQFEVYDRCGQELRRRIAEERTLMVAAYERQVAGYKEEIRRRLTEMKADLDRRLRDHDLLTQRIMRD